MNNNINIIYNTTTRRKMDYKQEEESEDVSDN